MAKNRLQKNKNVRPQPEKGAGDSPISIVNKQIDIRPFQRPEANIKSWRDAIRDSESRIRRDKRKFDLYAEVLLDGHVEAVMGKRIDPVTNAHWQFVDKDGVPVDEINELIDTIGFETIVKEIMMTKFMGYRMIECLFNQNADGEWEVHPWICPDANMRPHLGIIAEDADQDTGIDIRGGIYAKTIMEIGDTEDLGLLIKAAPYQILKRGGLGDYAMFVQVFGNPLVDATWDGFDEGQRLKLLEAIEALGSGGAIVRPEGTELNLIEQKYNANGMLQVNFITLLDKGISKALLGTTETVEASQSSGYAQSKTHDEQDKVKNESDLDYTRRWLNSRFRTILRAAGIDTKGGRFIIEGEDNELSVDQSFEMHKSMKKDLGIPISDDFFYETYGVPKPDNYDELKEQHKEPRDPDTEPPEEEEEEEVKLLDRLRSFFGLAPESGATHRGCCDPLITLASDQALDAQSIIDHYRSNEELTFSSRLHEHTSEQLLRAFRQGWKSNQWEQVQLMDLGFEWSVDDPALLTAYELNIFRFSAAKTLAQVQELNYLFRNTSSFRDFEKLARQSLDKYNQTWLETEYNTALLTGQSSAAYHRLLSRAEIFPYWKYRTVGDEHVRQEHQALDGLILPYNDPRWKILFPPNGWNCRCYIVPVMKAELPGDYKLASSRARADRYFKTKEFLRAKGSGWGVNRAMTGQIYAANQMYTTKQPGMAAKLLNALRWSDYELQSYSQARKVATSQLPTYNGSASDWIIAREILEERPVIRDYSNRPLIIDPKSYVVHTTGRRESRTALLHGLEQAVLAADEVWIRFSGRGSQKGEISYIKYYEDKTIVVIGQISKGKILLNTWFPLKESSKVINKYRAGVLVKK